MMRKYDLNDLQYDKKLAIQLKVDIIGEILKAIKLPDNKLSRTIIGGLTGLPTRRFAEIMADFDRVIGESGLQSACKHILKKLVRDTTAVGVEVIPNQGPVIIASNHPGTFDTIAITSKLPRKDVKIIAGANPFFSNLTSGSKFLLFATRDVNERVGVIRKAILHLQQGGLLLTFPYGRISPDPAILKGADDTIRKWSRSLEIFLRKLPTVKLVLAVTSGVITNEYLNHPLPNLFSGFERRRIIEFMQIIKQMIFHQTSDLHPKINFQLDNSQALKIEERMAAIQQQELNLLQSHMKLFYP